MARNLRTPDGCVIPYGLCCEHLWTEVGLRYYAVVRIGEEQSDYYCEKCYDRFRQDLPVPLGRCCVMCAQEVRAKHHLVEEVQP